jgi:serine/threonine-protein kinase
MAMLGQVFLNRYKIIRQLDEGGMSTIFLAKQTDLDRDVVVKVVKEQLRDQTKVREHFRREIYIMTRFEHPNAVTYYDSDLNDREGPVLVMEYVRGLPLDQLLRRDGRWNPERVGRLLVQLCDVLQTAHDTGIVHRDLKPGNLMILYPGTQLEKLKLMDFGLAKMSNLLYFSPTDLVDFNLPMASGTPEYIPPEQARGVDMDPRSDLYSVGVILYELLTGRRPFERETAEGLLDAHINDPPPTFAAMGAGSAVAPAIEAVVRSCLAKYPEERPASANDLIQRYEQALGRRLRASALSGIRRLSGVTMPTARSGSLSGVRPLVAVAGGSRMVPTVSNPARTSACSPPKRECDANSFCYSFQSVMPDAMALVKLKGFIHDLGGEVTESQPGIIRVRVPWLHSGSDSGNGSSSGMPNKSGLFAWVRRPVRPTPSAMEMEVYLERLHPEQPNLMTVTMVLRSPHKAILSAESRNHCQKLGLDLQAYLMGR